MHRLNKDYLLGIVPIENAEEKDSFDDDDSYEDEDLLPSEDTKNIVSISSNIH